MSEQRLIWIEVDAIGSMTGCWCSRCDPTNSECAARNNCAKGVYGKGITGE